MIDAEYSRQHRMQYHVVRVLDCDTVSQVKDKILDARYRNAPFFNRPSSAELDLGQSSVANLSCVVLATVASVVVVVCIMNENAV